MFTELAILYSKYKPEKLEDHLKVFYGRINIQKVLRVCERNQQWKEVTWLHKADNEFANAATTMIEHPIEAWDHQQFKDVIAKVPNVDIYYKAVRFYLRDHPLMVTDLLKALTGKVDHTKVVEIARKEGNLSLIRNYLTAVQSENVGAVNEALNELFIEEEDYHSLRTSIDTHDKFDNLALAKRLEKHELMEFRRIAAVLYKRNNQWVLSLELSKEDNLYTDAMKTAAESGDPDVVENLLRFFVDTGLHECFAACLYTCYDLARPDVVLELAWSHGLTDLAMPYLIQVIKEYTTRVDDLAKRGNKKDKPQEKETEGAPVGYPTGVVIDPYTGLPVGMQVMGMGGIPVMGPPLSGSLPTPPLSGGGFVQGGYGLPPGSGFGFPV